MRALVEAPIIEHVRLTVPAREALERAGNEIVEDGRWSAPPSASGSTYRVTMRRPPGGIELVLIGHGEAQHHALRLTIEESYPGEWPIVGVAWHERGYLVPCPECGTGLQWNEAGYVPGWRICLRGHAAQLSEDGRSAERHPAYDMDTE